MFEEYMNNSMLRLVLQDRKLSLQIVG